MTEPMIETISNEVLEEMVAEPNLAECKCITKEQVGWRVLQTQAKGKILSIPIILGEPADIWEATDLVDENVGAGCYAIRMPLYECGHDEMQWMEYWR